MANIYPQISIRSKNELAKQISSVKLPFEGALSLINNVIENYDTYWKDSKKSEPQKRKYVRTAVGTPLDTLLKAIDKKLLQTHDKLIPGFIFGGVKGKSHIAAAYHLVGNRNKRILLKMDISRFFEKITRERVFYFFNKKCNCSVKASNLLADLCCVPKGKKGSTDPTKTIARGFPTSSRLAIWTNLETFLKLRHTVTKKLKNHDPQTVIFVDDIGISASRTSKESLDEIRKSVQKILLSHDRNQPLPANKGKTKIIPFSEGAEHLGLLLGRNKISIGRKTKSRMATIRSLVGKSRGETKKSLIKREASYYRYKKQIEETII
ncbi:MAG: hypothetical protein GW947_02195 [Candidatus Pacebacteria bacterium]|nr:hypothetical protein [Candidatus Paceibacterota bacterium]